MYYSNNIFASIVCAMLCFTNFIKSLDVELVNSSFPEKGSAVTPDEERKITEFSELRNYRFHQEVVVTSQHIILLARALAYGASHCLVALEKLTGKKALSPITLPHKHIYDIKLCEKGIAVLGTGEASEARMILYAQDTLEPLTENSIIERIIYGGAMFTDVVMEGDATILVGGSEDFNSFGGRPLLKIHNHLTGKEENISLPDDWKTLYSVACSGNSIVVAGDKFFALLDQGKLIKKVDIPSAISRMLLSKIQKNGTIKIVNAVSSELGEFKIQINSLDLNSGYASQQISQPYDGILQSISYHQGKIGICLSSSISSSEHDKILMGVCSDNAGDLLVPAQKVCLAEKQAGENNSREFSTESCLNYAFSLDRAILAIGHQSVINQNISSPHPLCVIQRLNLDLKNRARAVVQRIEPRLLESIQDPFEKIAKYLFIQASAYEKDNRRVLEDVRSNYFSCNGFTEEEKTIACMLAAAQCLAATSESKQIMSGVKKILDERH